MMSFLMLTMMPNLNAICVTSYNSTGFNASAQNHIQSLNTRQVTVTEVNCFVMVGYVMFTLVYVCTYVMLAIDVGLL